MNSLELYIITTARVANVYQNYFNYCNTSRKMVHLAGFVIAVIVLVYSCKYNVIMFKYKWIYVNILKY